MGILVLKQKKKKLVKTDQPLPLWWNKAVKCQKREYFPISFHYGKNRFLPWDSGTWQGVPDGSFFFFFAYNFYTSIL